jgi:hypothetical protein
MRADCRVFINSRIRTMGRPARAQALACDASTGAILAVGGDAEVMAQYRGTASEVVDLGGLNVLPGLTDSHIHFVGWCLMRTRPHLEKLRSIEGCLEAVSEGLGRTRPGEWLVGTGWDKNLWGNGRIPSRRDLDRASRKNPVALWSKDWHALWLNSAALKRLGIARSTPEVAGGRIERDARGEPTGILREEAANQFYNKVPFPPDRSAKAAVLAGRQEFWRLGLTGFHSMEGPAEYRVLQLLDEERSLGLRGTLYFRHQHLDKLVELGLRTGFGSRRLRIGGIKLFVDGALGSQTAWMLGPYEKSRYRGMPVLGRRELQELVDKASAAGLACAVHAIGDAANRLALDVFEDARRTEKRLRHRIEHCQLVRPEDIRRFRRLGIVASVQPSHCPSDLDLIERHWGERGRHAYPFGAMARAGAALAFSSDAPIEDPDPWRGIQAAVTRQRIPADRPPFHPEQSVSVEQAVRAYTTGAAWASGDDGWKGSLEPGKAADFVCLSDDIFRIRPEEIHKVRVERTVVGGRTVFKK